MFHCKLVVDLLWNINSENSWRKDAYKQIIDICEILKVIHCSTALRTEHQ